MATRSYRPRLRALCLLAGLALVELCAPHGGPAGFVTPASAQFFDDRFPFLGDRRNRSNNSNWNRDFRDRDRDWRDWRENRPAPVQDFSKAPAPKKPDAAAVAAVTNIVVMGDSMADWLGYGLESAFADTPEIAVVRKQRHPSGLIRDLKPDSPDWPQIARETLNADKSAAYVVMMIGLNDRQQIRDRPAPRRAAAQPNQPLQLNPAQPAPPPAAGQAAQNPPPDAEGEPPPAATPVPAPEQAPAGPGTPHEFRSEKWAELYGKRIEETVAALKSKGVPVFWVGLPSIRGAKSTSEAIYLNELYRSHAEKAGITYIDVWDGFVDEAGRFTVQGPDFEGQIRRLRTGDGVHFTQAGARKLAHYVEREIRRSIAARGLPVAAIPPTTAPEEPAQPAVPADKPGLFPRPMAGPVVPLTARQASDQTLLGGGGTAKSAEPETAGTRVLVKGEPVPAPAGRSDDFAWPRRGVMPVGADPVVATSTEPPPVAQPVAPPPVQTAAGGARPGAAEVGRQAAAPVRRTPVVRQQPRYDPWRSNPWGGGWGGWGGGGGLFRW